VLTTSAIVVAFRWPSVSTAQLVVSIRHIADMRRAESGVPSCTFGGLQAQMATLYGTDSHNGPRRFVNWRNIPIALIDPSMGEIVCYIN
jgi:hypothetical protein